MLSVVPISKYCELSGEKVRTVQARIERGVWQEGKHVHKVKNVKERFVDLVEIEKWVRNGGGFRAA
ncbi:MAG: hypothetical protein ACJAUY_000624 [Cognaticolwellia sp.]|jgi:hypothetical protein